MIKPEGHSSLSTAKLPSLSATLRPQLRELFQSRNFGIEVILRDAFAKERTSSARFVSSTDIRLRQ